MKVATILPQHYLHLTQGDDYHMCLANLLFAPGMEAYTEHFMAIGHTKGKYLIMDNGVIEGDPRPIEELIHKAQTIGADEFILPDVFRDKDATLAAIKEAYEPAKATGIKLMAVPQGNTLEEWLECAMTIIGEYREIKVIGIPKVLVDIAGRDGRLIAIHRLAEMCPMLKHKEIHLLGCWKTSLEVLTVDKASRSGKIPMVRGVDSALPYVYSRAFMRMDCDDRPDSNPINFKDGRICTTKGSVIKEGETILKKNIRIWKASGDSRTLWEKVTDKIFGR